MSASSDPHGVYAIETVTELTQVSSHQILIYCRHGLLSPVGTPDEEGWQFDDDAIHRLRRIEFLRQSYSLNIQGLVMVSRMLGDMEKLKAELRFLRGA